MHKPELTARLAEVLHLICCGLDNKAIAARLYISPGTVKSHVQALLNRFGVSDRTQLALSALKLGVISLDEVDLSLWANVQPEAANRPVKVGVVAR